MAPENRDEVRQRIDSLYDQAENETGNFNATRAMAKTRSRGVPLAKRPGRRADPDLDAMTQQWFEAARSKLGPSVPAALPADRQPNRPARPARSQGLPTGERDALRLPALERDAGRAVAELPAGTTPASAAQSLPGSARPALPGPRRPELPAAGELPVGRRTPDLADRTAPEPAVDPGATALFGGGGQQSPTGAGWPVPAPRVMEPAGLAGTTPSGLGSAAAYGGATESANPAHPSLPGFTTPEATELGPQSLPGLTTAAAAGLGTQSLTGLTTAEQTGMAGYGLGTAQPNSGFAEPGGLGGTAAYGTTGFGSPTESAYPAHPSLPGFTTPEATGLGSQSLTGLTTAEPAGLGTQSPPGLTTAEATGTASYGLGTAEAVAFGNASVPGPGTAVVSGFSGAAGYGYGTLAGPVAPGSPAVPGPDETAVLPVAAPPSAPGASPRAPRSLPGTATPGRLSPGVAKADSRRKLGAARDLLSRHPAQAAAPAGTGWSDGGTQVRLLGAGRMAGLGAGQPGQPPVARPETTQAGQQAGQWQQFTTTTPATGVPAAESPRALRAAKAIAFARAQIGKPCVWGATGPDSYDCSSLTQAAWKAAGVTLPRAAHEQALAGAPVTLAGIEPGDLVLFFDDDRHVGLHVGGGMMVHAPGPGSTIREESIFGAGEAAIHRIIRPA
jgi:cell wall-associated NlpC family hydrolase